jgi:hypothetical protein
MTRKDPLDKLALRHDVAVRQFADAADELELVADQLNGLAAVSDIEATQAAMRSGTARAQAHLARSRAKRIRELLG